MTSAHPLHLVVALLLLLLRAFAPLVILTVFLWLGIRAIRRSTVLLNRGSLAFSFKRTPHTNTFVPELMKFMKRESRNGIRSINIAFVAIGIIALPFAVLHAVPSETAISDSFRKASDSISVFLYGLVPLLGLLVFAYIVVRENYVMWIKIRCFQRQQLPKYAFHRYLMSQYWAGVLHVTACCVVFILILISIKETIAAVFPWLADLESSAVKSMRFDLPDAQFYRNVEAAVLKVFDVFVALYTPFSTQIYIVIFIAMAVPYVTFRFKLHRGR